MRKIISLTFCAFLMIVSYQCKKSVEVVIPDNSPYGTVLAFAKDNIDETKLSKYNLTQYQIINDINGTPTAFAFSDKESSGRFLMIGKSETGFIGNFVDVSSMDKKRSTGVLKTASFDLSSSSEVSISSNRIVKIIKNENGEKRSITYRYEDEVRTSYQNAQAASLNEDEWEELPEVVVTATLNNTTPMNMYSLFYYFNQAPSYTYSYSTTNPTTGGGSGAVYYINQVQNQTSPAISNINDYLKCFTNIAGSTYTYKISLCVDQPNPNSRDAWGFGPNFNVGHTFLVLTQIGPNGTTTRNVGFYPNTSAKPNAPEDQGRLKNDAGRSYDVSVTTTMTNSQFVTVVNYLKTYGNNTGYKYNLNSNNCSTYACNALGSAGFNFPRTIGDWLGGSGMNPGDLGQDLRSMTLSSNMTRSTTNQSHPNNGTCP